MVAKKPSVGNLFENAGVGQSSQILQLKDQVESLQAEVTRLRANPSADANLEQQVQVLTEQLQAKTGEHHIPIDLIDPDPDQPRHTITEAMKISRAESLRQYGQIQSIIVIPQSNGRYKLFEGELRWRSAPLVPMKTLRAVFLHQEQDAATRFRNQLLTRLHSEDLHDLDLAEALIQDIQHKTGGGDERDIVQALDEGLRHLRKLERLRELGQLKQQSRQAQQKWIESVNFPGSMSASIFSTLLDLHLNPGSVYNNVFPLLFVPEDVKQAIRLSGLDSSKARMIARLENLNDRETVLRLTTESGLSLEEIKNYVAQLRPKEQGQPLASLKQQFADTVKRLNKSSVWKDPSRQKKLQKLMGQIEELLGEDA